MDVKKAILNRKSMRSFSDKKLSAYLISEIIKYAHLAPSAGNLQARDFIIVDDIDIKKGLSKAALNQEFIVEAPVNIIVCANLDASAAVEHILLLAVNCGLSACWVGAFNENEVEKILQLPPYIRPVAIIPIGHPKDKAPSTSRIDTKKLTRYNKW